MDFYIIIAFLGEFTTSFVFFFNTKTLDSWKRTKKKQRGGAIIFGETTSLSHTHVILFSERKKVITRELHTHTPSAFRGHRQRVIS
jgi:hypothetical protein